MGYGFNSVSPSLWSQADSFKCKTSVGAYRIYLYTSSSPGAARTCVSLRTHNPSPESVMETDDQHFALKASPEQAVPLRAPSHCKHTVAAPRCRWWSHSRTRGETECHWQCHCSRYILVPQTSVCVSQPSWLGCRALWTPALMLDQTLLLCFPPSHVNSH